MTSEATPPPGPDDKPAETSPSSSGGARVEPGAALGEATPPEPEATAAADKPAEEAAADKPAEEAAADKPAEEAARLPAAPAYQPSYVFLGLVSFASLVADLASKEWAKVRLEDAKSFDDRHIEVIPNLLSFVFARNKGGAWGLLQDQPESIRRPFFLGVSVLAIIFIVSLYRRLTPQQTALKWGLPLVLGGALGNLINRVQYNYVIDFIDVYISRGGKEHHWPTFNVADIAICVGVGLMAVDMFTSRRMPAEAIAKAEPRAAATAVPEALSKATGDPTGDAKVPDAKAAAALPDEPLEGEALDEAPKPVEKASEGT
jgi:signal peptidase II